MLTQRLRFIGACNPLLIGGVIAASLAALVIVSDAKDLPVFRKGIWEFTRTVDKGRLQIYSSCPKWEFI